MQALDPDSESAEPEALRIEGASVHVMQRGVKKEGDRAPRNVVQLGLASDITVYALVSPVDRVAFTWLINGVDKSSMMEVADGKFAELHDAFSSALEWINA